MEGRKYEPRRSSILAQQIAKECLEGFGSDIQQNLFGRSSNGSRGATRSKIPTPISSAVSSNKSSLSTAERGTLQFPASQRNFMGPTSSSAAKVKATVQLKDGSKAQNMSIKKSMIPGSSRQTSVQRSVASQRQGSAYSGVRSGMRRSSSVDSFATMSQTVMTPCLSPAMSMKSSQSSRKWGSASDINNCGQAGQLGKIRVPGSDEKKTMHEMMSFVSNFLNSHGYRIDKPSELKESGDKFIKYILFVGRLLVGPKYLPDSKDKDATTNRIMEVSKLLGYPVVLSKSVLKSVLAPHAWPHSLTFLTWLCCRASQAIEPRKSRMEFLEAYPCVAIDNFLRLFIFSKKRSKLKGLAAEQYQAALQEQIEKELDVFREKVGKSFMTDSDLSKEELLAERADLERQIQELQEQPDPAKDIELSIEALQRHKEEVMKSMSDSQMLFDQLTNFQAIEEGYNNTEFKISACEADIQKLQEKIRLQSLDKEGERLKLQEIEELRKQNECSDNMLEKLALDLTRKQQVLKNLDDRCRSTISNFTVVETFNTNLSNLKVDGLVVPVNPLNPVELPEWLDIVQQAHKQTETRCKQLRDGVKDTYRMLLEQTAAIEGEISAGAKEYGNSMGELQYIQNELDYGVQERSQKEDSLQIDLKKMDELVGELEAQISEGKSHFLKQTEKLSRFKAMKIKNQEAEEKWKKALENEMEKFMVAQNYVGVCMKLMVEKMLTQLQEIRQQRKKVTNN